MTMQWECNAITHTQTLWILCECTRMALIFFSSLMCCLFTHIWELLHIHLFKNCQTTWSINFKIFMLIFTNITCIREWWLPYFMLNAVLYNSKSLTVYDGVNILSISGGVYTYSEFIKYNNINHFLFVAGGLQFIILWENMWTVY